MGDFERTFGEGADAVSVVDGFARERQKELYGGGSRATQGASKTGSVEGDTIFADLGSGVKLVKKASIDAFYDEANDLDRNGSLYGNDYTIFIPNGVPMSPEEATESLEGALLLVLRDSYDITQALIGIVDGRVRHLLGLEPRQPRQLSDPLFNTFKSHNWTIGTGYSEFGWVSNQAGKWFSVSELPTRFTVSSNLYLRGTDISVLPEGMTVGGDLNLSGTKIENLPNRLTVGGDLDLEKAALKHLPKELTVGGDIFVGRYRVVLPSCGSLTEEVDPYIISSSSRPNVTVGGNLRLDISALAILPRGATVIASSCSFGGILSKQIEELPAGIMYMQLPDDHDFR
ncbi:hypothetical protein NKI82_26390 [Mesorhizobium sp. M0482]|uniref:hypothetical protein n=1 Tax=Mesorhizobium sp. M0482 TaxID=2956948 RepID=UPI00333AA823